MRRTPGASLGPGEQGAADGTTTSAERRPGETDEPQEWLANPDLARGEAPWEARPPEHATLDPAGAEGRPTARLDRAPGPGEPVVWRQTVVGLPTRRQVSFSARVRVADGEAQLWVRCRGADSAEINGRHQWGAPRATAAEGWQALAFIFVVPPDATSVEVGGAVLHCGRAWFSDFELRLIPDDEERLRATLSETLVQQGSMPTAACRRAFRRVPRHRFLPNSTLAEAYTDDAIPTHVPDREGRGPISSSSQPTMMAIMLGQLRLRPGLRVLEIGAGTGYNAALLARLVGAKHVTSIDLDEVIVAEARSHLDATGYREVFVDAADGWDGCPARAPYDRIIITVGVQDLAPAWVEQLREGGVLVAPFSFGCAQIAPAFRKRSDRLVSEQISYSFFMDLRGKRPRQITRRHGDRLVVTHDTLDVASLALLDEVLDAPAEPLSAPELVEVGTEWLKFQNFWTFATFTHPLALGINDPRFSAYGVQGTAFAIADLERRQIAIAGVNLCFGGHEIGDELRRLARHWLDAGRPGLERLVLAAYPRAAFPRAGLLPPGRWAGLVEKERTWFRWRYRKVRREDDV